MCAEQHLTKSDLSARTSSFRTGCRGGGGWGAGGKSKQGNRNE